MVSIDELMMSQWFTRGWTLQHLIAPDVVRFFSADWVECGNRNDLALYLYEITNIDPEVLNRPPDADVRQWLYSHSISKRMSWAAARETEVPEDTAYCLFGLFNVNMPLIYGEGGSRAFHRLQEEIMKYSTDQTILAWSPAYQALSQTMGVLADSPSAFRDGSRIVPIEENNRIEMTSKGVRTANRVHDFNKVVPYSYGDNGLKVILLDCVYANEDRGQLGITVTNVQDEQPNGSVFLRMMHSPVVVPVRLLRDEVGSATALLAEMGNEIPFGDWEYSSLTNERLLRGRFGVIQKYLQELRVTESIYIAQNHFRRQQRDTGLVYCHFPLLRVQSVMREPSRKFSLSCPALDFPHVELHEISTARFDASQQIVQIFLTESYNGHGPNLSPAQIILARSTHDETRLELVEIRCHCETFWKCSSTILEPQMDGNSFVRCNGFRVEMQVRVSHEKFIGKLFNVINVSVQVFGVARMVTPEYVFGKPPSKIRGFLLGKSN
jgi:hypothetical protein